MNYDYQFGNSFFNYYGDKGIKSTEYKIIAPEQSQNTQPGRVCQEKCVSS